MCTKVAGKSFGMGHTYFSPFTVSLRIIHHLIEHVFQGGGGGRRGGGGG